jgi:hypothetical protein
MFGLVGDNEQHDATVSAYAARRLPQRECESLKLSPVISTNTAVAAAA